MDRWRAREKWAIASVTLGLVFLGTQTVGQVRPNGYITACLADNVVGTVPSPANWQITTANGVSTFTDTTYTTFDCPEANSSLCGVCGETIIYTGPTSSGPWTYYSSTTAEGPIAACGTTGNQTQWTDKITLPAANGTWYNVTYLDVPGASIVPCPQAGSSSYVYYGQAIFQW